MNLLIAPSGGRNLVVRPGARPTFYAMATLQPAIVEVYWRYADEPPNAAKLIGRYLPGQQIGVPVDRSVHRDIYLSTISISAGGVRSVRDVRDAPALLVSL